MSESNEVKKKPNIYDGKVITDSLGRKLKLRDVSVLDAMDLLEAVEKKFLTLRMKVWLMEVYTFLLLMISCFLNLPLITLNFEAILNVLEMKDS